MKKIALFLIFVLVVLSLSFADDAVLTEENKNKFTESALKDQYYFDGEEESSFYDESSDHAISGTSGSLFDIEGGFNTDEETSLSGDDLFESSSASSSSSAQSTTTYQSSSFVPSIEAKLVPDTQDITVYSSVPADTKVGSSNDYDFLSEDGYFRAVGRDEESGIIFVSDANGEEFVEDPIIYVVEEQGPEAKIIGAVLKKYVTVASFAQKEELADEYKDEFVLAFDELKKADDLSDLVTELVDYIGDDVYEGYSITQLFFVGPKFDVEQYIDEYDLLHLRMVFPVRLQEGTKEAPIICYKIAEVEDWEYSKTYDGKQPGDWGMIKMEDVILNWPKDGRIAADFHHFGTILFLEPKAKN